ncbi:hypothetical protein BV378_01390 [Nostoc sp. RF31YmG]|jgi:hypothetical protein|nr:hypothetical protein BV378_01390 [Nostoc sp. RF31YmG]OUL36064.1 hypothetical protein BV375_00935 [Nostoc sp. 106C]
MSIWENLRYAAGLREVNDADFKIRSALSWFARAGTIQKSKTYARTTIVRHYERSEVIAKA